MTYSVFGGTFNLALLNTDHATSHDNAAGYPTRCTDHATTQTLPHYHEHYAGHLTVANK